MKSISLSTGIFVAILGVSLPTQAETPSLAAPLFNSTACHKCSLSPTELQRADISFSSSTTIQIPTVQPPLAPPQSHLLKSSKNNTPIQVNTTAQFATLMPEGTADIQPDSADESRQASVSNPASSPSSESSRPTTANLPQQVLLAQQDTSTLSPSLPPPSTRAADLAQVEPTPPDSSEDENNSEAEESEEAKESKQAPRFSPLANQQFQQPTAIHLPKGTVAFHLTNRLFFLPEAGDGTAAYPNFGVTWGITDRTELDLTLQVVDSGSPERLGPFGVVRRVSNRDLTLSLKQRLWNNPEDTLALSGVFSLAAPLTNRSFEFNPGGIEREDGSLIPALQFPFTATFSDRMQLTLSPTIAFFPDDNAVFIPRPPLANAGSFGTTLGLSGAASYQVHPRITLWGDAFVPFTGNNSFNRDSGQPAKSIAYNAGLRYFLNPSLGLDVFASNSFGSKGPLALTADRDITSLGLRVISLPSLLGANRQIADSFNSEQADQDSPNTTDGLAYFDGGTVPSQRFLFHLQGGGQGILTALRYGVVKDFELSAYLDYIFGSVDESEQGFGAKLRFLNQDEGAPLTASAAVTVGLTNNLFDNFNNNSRTGRDRQGAEKDFPLIFRADSQTGRRFVVTLSLPLHYEVNDQLAFWFTPTAGLVQRDNLELGGFNVGGSYEVIPDFSLVGELGANLLGDGNAFIGNTLADRIPWSLAVRWNPSKLLGGDGEGENQPNVEVFVTNRVGSSTWNQLRVRDQNELTVGAGVAIPF